MDELQRLRDEIRLAAKALAESWEEINLLYSISETLGSILGLEDAANAILAEVCDVLGARRGSLWVYDAENALLRLTASVGGPFDLEGAGGNAPDEAFRKMPQVGQNQFVTIHVDSISVSLRAGGARLTSNRAGG